jgi:malonyl CoA-acyl carrier protein transacylase
MPIEIVALSADEPGALLARCRLIAQQCQSLVTVAPLAQSSLLSFDANASMRLVLVSSSKEELLTQLQSSDKFLSEKQGRLPLGAYLGEGRGGPIAFLFPGQGSQYLQMGAALMTQFDPVRALWDEADSLPGFARESLRSRVSPEFISESERVEQESRLTQTEWAQPALTCTSLSMLRLLFLLDVRPMCVAGHSLGEVTALAAAGALSPLGAILVSRARGELMAEASRTTEGAMLAVSSDSESLARLLSLWRLPVCIANHNAPQQVVLSGSREAIREAEQRLSQERIAAKPLPVATAFHSPIVAGACVPFRDMLREVSFGSFDVPVFSNVTAKPYPEGADEIREQLSQAISSPVRFLEMIQAMYQAGARTFIEVGPEAVLTRLVGRCLRGEPHLAVALDQPGKDGVVSLSHALARLAASGVKINLSRLAALAINSKE